VKALNWPS
jgi:4-oxalocrotonate tautomerase